MLLAAHAGTFDNGWISCNQKLLHHGPGNEVQKLTRNMYLLHPRPGLGQASVSLGAPRMPTNLLHHDPKTGPKKL